MNTSSILIEIRKIVRSINIESKRIEKNHGISIPQLLCLTFLNEQKDLKSTSTKIKEYLQLNASTVTGIITRLQQKGMVAKLPNPEDKRSSSIALTKKGKELLTNAPDLLHQRLSIKLSELPEKNISALQESLDLITQLLEIDITDNEVNQIEDEINNE
jgi:DNA-binding MarR family transcriptional regulator